MPASSLNNAIIRITTPYKLNARYISELMPVNTGFSYISVIKSTTLLTNLAP